jgi:hypothetical protein
MEYNIVYEQNHHLRAMLQSNEINRYNLQTHFFAVKYSIFMRTKTESSSHAGEDYHTLKAEILIRVEI